MADGTLLEEFLKTPFPKPGSELAEDDGCFFSRTHLQRQEVSD